MKYIKWICSEFTILKKVDIFGIYWSLNLNNLTKFFEEMTTSLDNAIIRFYNLIVLEDFDIDVKI